jgi:hypothetical protein
MDTRRTNSHRSVRRQLCGIIVDRQAWEAWDGTFILFAFDSIDAGE